MGLDAATLAPESLGLGAKSFASFVWFIWVLRPLDEIEPYRLEMGSRLKTAGSQSLYQYWGRKVSDALNAEAEATKSNILVNCASKEYFSVVDLTTLETIPVVTPVFMENKSGKAKNYQLSCEESERCDGALYRAEQTHRQRRFKRF